MVARLMAIAAALLLHASTVAAQEAPGSQPLTFYYDYTVKPGKEEEFLNLVKTVGGPVRDKLMAEGVVREWGVEVPILRVPEEATHTIWYVTNDYDGVGKVQAAMAEALAKPAAGATAKGARAMTNAEKALEVFDMSKTKDWLTRDIERGSMTGAAPAGLLPYTRYNFFKVVPGKGAEWRRLWVKYSKPVYDKLVADGVIMAWGLSVEEIRTSGDFTHFVWYVTPDMAGFDKVRAAFIADRDKRSQEERDAITASFAGLTDTTAFRSLVTRSLIIRMAPPK